MYPLAWWRRLPRSLLRGVFRGIFRLFTSIKVQGQENIPLRQAYLVAFNHVSIFDPAFVLAFWPETLEVIGAVEVWKRPGQDWLARLYGGIPVRRGEYDRQALEMALAALRAARPLLIAPEGGRSHQPGLRRAKPGIAYLVDEAGVPVVPVGVVGTTDDFLQKAMRGQRPPLEMRIGRPVLLPPLHGRGEERRLARQKNADLIMKHIAALLPLEYVGVYQEENFLLEET